MNCHVCQGEVTEENSRLMYYPDNAAQVRICDGCIEIKLKWFSEIGSVRPLTFSKNKLH